MNSAIDPDLHIFVAGHRGMVGSALIRRLRCAGYRRISTRPRNVDLRDQAAVRACLRDLRPDFVFLVAARVGGILANRTFPAEFIYDNLAIQTNLIHAAYEAGVRRLVSLGSSCIYPAACSQPMREDDLLGGPLEPANEAYAVAKIAGVKMCEAYNRQYGTHYVSLMPANLYGPNDNYDLCSSRVIPALIRKAHEALRLGAPEMDVWGSGRPRREFMHVDDLADACTFVMERGLPGWLYNVGTGRDITIRELAELIKDVVGFRGCLSFDTGKPDGAARKLLDISRLAAAGWTARIPLRQGLAGVYRAFSARSGGGAGHAPRPERPPQLRIVADRRWLR